MSFATPVAGIDPVELAAGRLHGNELLAVRRRVDAVQVQLPVDVGVVAAERDRLRVAESSARPDRNLVENRLPRIGEVRGVVRDDDVVDERRRPRWREAVRANRRTGRGVVDVRVARAGAGDEEPVVAVELDAGRRLPGSAGKKIAPLPVRRSPR